MSMSENRALAIIVLIGLVAMAYTFTHERSIEDMNGLVWTLKGLKM